MGQPLSEPDWLPHRMVVKLQPAATRAPQVSFWEQPAGREALRAVGATAARPTFPGHRPPTTPQPVDLSRIFTLELAPGADPWTASELLARLPEVEYAEPWFIHQPFFLPNDYFTDTTKSPGLWYLKQIKAFEAWDLAFGDTSIVIAVIDAGQTRHPDLYGNIAFNHMDPIDGLDNDQDGYVDNFEGWDLSGNTYGAVPDGDPFVGNAHGLWVAGVSSAIPNNVIGLTGIGGNCRYLPIKAAPDDSLGLIFEGYPGIVYAADQGAKVINCSWGSARFSRFGHDVVRYATEVKEAAVIAACGNSASETVFYPAGYPEAISVANTTYNDEIFQGASGLSGSTYHRTVDISAPGWAIMSCANQDGYFGGFAGTSFSAPIVAGAAGLVLGHFPDLTGVQAAQRLRVTSDPIDSLNSPQYHDRLGLGRVNLLRALTDPLRPSLRMLAHRTNNQSGTDQLRPGDTISLFLSLVNLLHPSSQDLSLQASLSLLNTPFVEVLSQGAQPGQVAMNGQIEPLIVRFVIRPNTPENYPVSFRLTYHDIANGYRDAEHLNLLINPSWTTLDINDLFTTVTSRGGVGFEDFPNNQQGEGLAFGSRSPVLTEGGVLVGLSPTQVSDVLRNSTGRDQDFRALEPLFRTAEDPRADLVVRGRMDDASASNPIGVEVRQTWFGWDDPDRRQFLVLQLELTNSSPATWPNLFTGLMTDWDIAYGTINQNAADYLAASKLSYTEDRFGGDPVRYGVSVLSEQPFSTYAVSLPGSFAMSTAGKFQALSSPLLPTTGKSGGVNGANVLQFTSAGPIGLAAGAKDTLAFALLAGTAEELPLVREEAYRAWRCDVLQEGPWNLFALPPGLVPGLPLQVADTNPKATSWTWDFGDGTVLSGKTASHVYSEPGYYQVRLTVSDGFCSKVHARAIWVDEATFLPADLAEGIRLFPNPNAGRFMLRAEAVPAGRVQVWVTDVQGKVLWNEEQQHNGGPFDQEVRLQLPAGMYFLQVEAGTWRRVVPWVKTGY